MLDILIKEMQKSQSINLLMSVIKSFLNCYVNKIKIIQMELYCESDL